MIICDVCGAKEKTEQQEIDTVLYDLCDKCVNKINDFLEGKAEIITKEEYQQWKKIQNQQTTQQPKD